MQISATYICPIRGLVGLEPPEPARLGRAAKVAKSLGLERLLLPVLEEPLLQGTKAKVKYLDGLVKALDQVAEARLKAWLIAPAQRILGLNFVAPYLVRGVRDPKAGKVFMDGRIRNLWPFSWWADPFIFQKRIRLLCEVVTAIHGHTALTGWLILDRALEWARPELHVAEIVLRSYLAEIRERDESGTIYMGLGWSELLDPQMPQVLAAEVDGFRMSGSESEQLGLKKREDLVGELLMAAYLGTVTQWLFRRPIEVEIGWSLLEEMRESEEIIESARRLNGQGLDGVSWLSLVDPDPPLSTKPPWSLWTRLGYVGLLNHALDPKEHVECLINELRLSDSKNRIDDFIDISPEEYIADPRTQLPRLWDHFRESI